MENISQNEVLAQKRIIEEINEQNSCLDQVAQKVWKLFKSEVNELLTTACKVLLKTASVAVKQKLATAMTVFKNISREDLEDYKKRDTQIGQAGRNSSEEQN